MVLYSYLGKVRDKLLFYINRPWYPFLISFLAAIDFFILIIPTDALMISAVLGRRSRWLLIALLVAGGSTLGAILMLFLIRYNQEWITQTIPYIFHSSSWHTTESLMEKFGGFALFIGAIGPLPLQPFTVLAGLSKLNFLEIIFFILLGRISKFILFAWIATSAPEFLKKLKIPHKL